MKDMLEKADVDPDSLKTWDGHVDSARKLNPVLNPGGILFAGVLCMDAKILFRPGKRQV